MSSSISSATSQQQFFQQVQNTPKQDATAKASNQSTSAALTTQQAAITTTGTKGVPESKFFRNSDGTYGPNHTATAPFNPNKIPAATEASSSQESSGVGVNVKV